MRDIHHDVYNVFFSKTGNVLQVMYMYYFLGHKLLTLKKSRRSKQIIAENTFILALDGDVDFQPSAVQLLVDRMKKNLTVGAACGRIHPIGGGKCYMMDQCYNSVCNRNLVYSVIKPKILTGNLALVKVLRLFSDISYF